MRLRSFQARMLVVFLASLTAVQVMTFAIVYLFNTHTAKSQIRDNLMRGGVTLERLMSAQIGRAHV